MDSASDEMQRALGVRPLQTSDQRGWSSLRTHLWRHEAFHGRVEPMAEHVVMGYFDTPRVITRHLGRSHARSVTENHSVTLIPAGHTAAWDIDGRLDVVHVYVPTARLRRVAESLELAALELLEAVARPSAALAGLARRMADELRLGDALRADTLSEQLCLQLLRDHSGGSGSAWLQRALDRPAGLAPWQVRRVQDYLLGHIDRQVRLQELAELLQRSPKHLCTAFRQATGQPPHAWISERRMERAQALLRQPGADLSQVALALGYPDQSTFGTAFRKATGLSPGRWRRAATA